jgi:hypothetical protein
MYPTLPHIGIQLGKNLYYFLVTKSQSFLQVSASYSDYFLVTLLAGNRTTVRAEGSQGLID